MEWHEPTSLRLSDGTEVFTARALQTGFGYADVSSAIRWARSRRIEERPHPARTTGSVFVASQVRQEAGRGPQKGRRTDLEDSSD